MRPATTLALLCTLALAGTAVPAAADPPFCSITKAMAPGWGPFIINDQGDVWTEGDDGNMQKIFDCPPYDV